MQTHTLVVLALVLTACLFDVRTRRIPNRLTLGAALAALVTALIQGGLAALGWSAAGWLMAVILFFPFFALRGMGAGDVKLLGAVGAWLGPLNALYLGFFTALAGGVCALIVVLVHGYARQAFKNLWLLMTHWRVGGIRPLPELTLEHGQGLRLAYAIPIAVGTVTTLWLR
jgi:prepilin peptidase CpaA